jgi:hypothetical protein
MRMDIQRGCGREGMNNGIPIGKLEGKRPSGSLILHGRIILKRISNRM